MKTTLGDIRRLIKESLLLEEKCPGCGAGGAYIGLNNVECKNPKCRFYTSSGVDLRADIASGQAGTTAYLSDGRVIHLSDITEDILPYEDYVDAPVSAGSQAATFDRDEEWGFFDHAVAQRALELAGVTVVIDFEMIDGEEEMSIEEYRKILMPLRDPELIKLLKDSEAKIKQAVDSAPRKN